MKPIFFLIALGVLSGCTVEVLAPTAEAPGGADRESSVVRPSGTSLPTPRPTPTLAPVPTTVELQWDAVVAIGGGRFEPGKVRLLEGGTVTYVNQDNLPHSLSGEREVKLEPGGTFEALFAQPGRHEVACRLHPGERVLLDVVDPDSVLVPLPRRSSRPTSTPAPSVLPSATPSPTPIPSATPTPRPMGDEPAWSDGAVPPDGAFVAGPRVTFAVPAVPEALKYRIRVFRGTPPQVGDVVAEISSTAPIMTVDSLATGAYTYEMTAYLPRDTKMISTWIRFQVGGAP